MISIGVAKEILLKSGKLNTIEKTVVESHCHIGNVIIRKELGKTRTAEFVRDHHENWDGIGYPRRLVGEEISVQGRIIRICDSFDTMTYDLRNYKSAKMSYHEAFQELKSCSWTQFYGNLVETFISLLIDLELPESWYDTYNSTFIEKIYNKIEHPEDIL